MNASPTTTSTKPATSVCAFGDSTLTIAADPAPSRTNTTVKPRMNGMLAIATRRDAPRSPNRPASTLDTAER